jgi:hypothetical protein
MSATIQSGFKFWVGHGFSRAAKSLIKSGL